MRREIAKALALGAGLLACVIGVMGCPQVLAAAPTAKTAKVKRAESIRIADLGLEMLAIPAGSFLRGSPANEPERWGVETQHPVTLTKPFWLGKYPVTQGQYEKLMGANPSWFTAVGKDAPVEQVSWADAMEFCKKLNERERAAGRLPKGYEYSLPTEAQWEYACRAGTTTPFSFGSVSNGTQANCNGDVPYGAAAKGPYLEKTSPVGKYPANAWGLHDMHGNVNEWCFDWHGGYPYGKLTDPVRTAVGGGRVIRGGYWGDAARNCRSAFRSGLVPAARSNDVGFRVALRAVR